MIKIKSIIDTHGSPYSAAKVLGNHPTQLGRWYDNDALVDESNGDVYIKTAGGIKNANAIKDKRESENE